MNISPIIRNDLQTGRLEFILKMIFIFGLIYDINFTFLPSITTARICFLALVTMSVFYKKKLLRSTKTYIVLLLFVLIVAIFQYSFSMDSTQISRLIWFILYGVVSPSLFISFVKNKNEFLYLISIAVGIQAGLSIFSFINPSVKSLFYKLIIFTSNFTEEESLRAVGFTSIGGAALSVIQSFGVITTLLLLKKNVYGFYKSLLLWSLIIVIIISIVLIGRTGLFISFFYIALYFVREIKNTKNIVLFSIIIFILFNVDFISILTDLTHNVDGFNVNLFSNWIEGAFKLKNNKTSEALANMPIPPLSLETLLGTGMVVNPYGIGNASGHDSGYIQTYYSLGLLMAIFFYSSYLLFLIKQIPRKSRYLYLLVIIMFVIEVKEFFIFQYIYPFFVLCMIGLARKFEFKHLKSKVKY